MDTPKRQQPLLTIDDVAARLGVQPRFVRRLVQQRRIPFHKIGKFVRFEQMDLDEFIDRGRVDNLRPGG
jgi:excisionase family DNA binding protein